MSNAIVNAFPAGAARQSVEKTVFDADERVVLVDRVHLRHAVDRGRRHEDDPPHLALDVVAEEAAGTEVALTLEEHVVDGVIDVDQEPPGRDAAGAAAKPAM